jgi:hypothetical protein
MLLEPVLSDFRYAIMQVLAEVFIFLEGPFSDVILDITPGSPD